MTMSAPSARAMGTYLVADSTTPCTSTLPSSQRLSQSRMGGGAKPITATLTVLSMVFPSLSLALTFLLMMVYGLYSVAPSFLLLTLASTSGNAGPLHVGWLATVAMPSTLNLVPVTCDRKGRP